MKYLASLVLTFYFCISVLAIAPVCQQATINIVSGDNTVVFGGNFSHIIIKTSPSAATVYIDPNNNIATTSDFQLDPGSSLALGVNGYMAATPGFHYYGASAAGTLSWIAW